MRRSAAVFLALIVALVAIQPVVLSHCEIPCGIYGDNLRFALLLEDITTVEKSMVQIEQIMQSEPVNANQVARWVMNKEDHANKIQHVVTQYFMTQRVKPADPENPEAYRKYIRQLTTLHNLLVQAMKAKQTTDLQHVQNMRDLVKKFAEAYLSEEDLKHLQEHHGVK